MTKLTARPRRLAVAALAGLSLVAACTGGPEGPLTDPPGAALPDALAETPASAALRAHFAQVQASLLAQDLLRTDLGGEDAPFTDRQLAENFLRIAFYQELGAGGLAGRGRAAPMPLTRWQEPIRVSLVFGPSVGPEVRAVDSARIVSFLTRLSQLTGHPIGLVDQDPNYWIHIASVEERAGLGPALAAALTDATPQQIAAVTEMDRNTYCQVLTQSDPATATYNTAVVVIPSEHADLMRLACIHEELAQSLGLPNDSNAARPSIFNDDEEYALLTRQDELMLRLLYDPALRPGMTEARARPIVQSLASRLMGGDS
jgi:Protein of unknown function (DUF2927)